MTERKINVLVFTVIVLICLGFGFYLLKPNTSIGVSTEYDKNAVLNTLNTLKSNSNSKPTPAYNDLRLSLIKQCLVLPASIYTDLMYEFKKQTTEANKIKDYKTMLDLYIKALGNDYKKTFDFKGGGEPSKTKTFEIKNKVFYITPFFETNIEYPITLVVYELVNSKELLVSKFENVENNKTITISYGEGSFFIKVDSKIPYWKLTIADGK